MKIIEKHSQEWKPETKHQTAPLKDDPINEECILIDADTKQFVAAQLFVKPEAESICAQISRLLRYDVKWVMDSARLSGIRSVNKVFGTLEPNKLRRRYGCQYAMLNKEKPELISLLDKMSEHTFELFEEASQDIANFHKELVYSSVHKDWLIADTPFTSGVINNSAALPYHRDSGNILGAWSTMLSLRKNMNGGHLHLPEYDLTLGIPDKSVTIFCGQAIWHGVTPMIPTKKDAHRFTIVWYAKRNVCNCVSAEEEPQRAARQATKRT
jgi:hypothetical protein